jgi:hypothetical protein
VTNLLKRILFYVEIVSGTKREEVVKPILFHKRAREEEHFIQFNVFYFPLTLPL